MHFWIERAKANMNAPEESEARPYPVSGNPRNQLAALFLLTLAGLAYGLVQLWPYLLAAHRRLEPWKIPLLWLGDAFALVWFVKYFARHVFLDQPLATLPAASVKNPLWLVVLTSCPAFGFDLGFTVYEAYTEYHARQGSVTTKGTVYAFYLLPQKTGAISITGYYRYTDPFGMQRLGKFHAAIGEDGKGTNPSFPEEVWDHFRNRQVPFEIQVSYDPAWPERSWATAVPNLMNTQIFWLSACTVLVQIAFFPVFLAALRERIQQGEVPWWYDCYQVYPLVLESGILVLVGTMVWLNGFSRYELVGQVAR